MYVSRAPVKPVLRSRNTEAGNGALENNPYPAKAMKVPTSFMIKSRPAFRDRSRSSFAPPMR